VSRFGWVLVAVPLAIGGAAFGLYLMLKPPADPEPPPAPPQKQRPGPADAIAPTIAGYAAALRDSRNPYYGTLQAAELEAALAKARSDPERAKILKQLGMDALRFNDVAKSTGRLGEALAIARTSGRSDIISRALYDLGVAHLRQAMLENCLASPCPEG
jgi:hypothetical protein